MTFRFTIPGRLAGANDYTFANRAHWAAGAKLRTAQLEICRKAVWEAMIKQNARFANAVGVSFAWIEPNAKRDLDNITGAQKVILDALVLCQVIPDDSRRWVKRLSHEFPEPDKANPRVVVLVEIV